MTNQWESATHTVLRVRAHTRDARAAVVVDPALTSHPATSLVDSWLGTMGVLSTISAMPATVGLIDLTAVGEEVLRSDLVVAVGGGSTLDRVKLATVAAASERVLAHVELRSRTGLVMLPVDADRPTPLIAVPTTLGTGAESSAVAVLDEADRRRLVLGPALRPQAAVLDGRLSEGLLPVQVAEGVLEVLARLAGPYCSVEEAPFSTSDLLVEAAVRGCGALGEQICRPGRRPEPMDPQGSIADGSAILASHREELLRLGAASHSQHLRRLQSRWGAVLWPLANELAFVTGSRKMVATLTLWPGVWRSALAGDRRYGNPERIVRLWNVLREAIHVTLPVDPAAGIAALARRWGAHDRVSTTSSEATKWASRSVRAWGSGLPVLAGLSVPDLLDLLRSPAFEAVSGA